MVKPQIPKGFRDFLPEKMVLRKKIIAVMTDVFETFGFEPLDTPCLEYAETLEGKYGEEGDKLIYRFQDRGGRNVALRYDLTIPLSRVVSMHPEIQKPFKRYQIAPVWRADKPQKGRFREFYQCDVDIVGSTSTYADGELLAVTDAVLTRLGFDNFVMRINNRKVLNAVAARLGIKSDSTASFLRTLDKLDKAGLSGVCEELSAKGLLSGDIEKHLDGLLHPEGDGHDGRLDFMGRVVKGLDEGVTGVSELANIHETLKAHGVSPDRYAFDFTLARGLDYYTGPVFETVVREHGIGSITGGGRYDNLIGLFSKHPLPATGTSFGLERIVTVLDDLGNAGTLSSAAQVMTAQFNESMMPGNLKMAGMLRDAGIRTEVYFTPDKLKKQLSHAAGRGIRYVLILGPDEAARNEVTLRDMAAGTQKTVAQQDMVALLKKDLAAE